MIQFISPLVRQEGLAKTGAPSLDQAFIFQGERLGLQVELELEEKRWINLNQNMSLPWSGLTRAWRIEVQGRGVQARVHFEASVADDDGIPKKDRILRDPAGFLGVGSHVLWVEVEAPAAGSYPVQVRVLEREGYQAERLVCEDWIQVQVADHGLVLEEDFYLDLWQHPSSLANYYRVEAYSEEHFQILEKFLQPLGQAGQKVCGLVVSDYPWSGQSCHTVKDQASSLYEYNIIGVSKAQGQFQLDFSALDRYIGLCERLGMASEINLFGLLDNWDRHGFSHPLEDYGDAIRVRYYDHDRQAYDFMRKKEEVRGYISRIFDHLKQKGYWSQVKVMGDMPKDREKSMVYQDFLRSIAPDVSIKYALHLWEYVRESRGQVESYSLALPTLLQALGDEDPLLEECRQQMTWYVCRFPKNFNQFIKSPLVESRLVGYYTYAFGLKGFLRWNYCLWPEEVDQDTRYRPEKWPAGDMFFVYPGRGGWPEPSLRFKHLVYGIEEYRIFRAFEEKIGPRRLAQVLGRVLGDLDELTYDEEEDLVSGYQYMDDFEKINQLKRELFQALGEAGS